MSVELHNVSFSYRLPDGRHVQALSDVNLIIPQGCYFALAGATGSGKSTLVQLLNGLLLPSTGKVVVDRFTLDAGQRPSANMLTELRRHVGLVFQFPEHQLFEETVAADIAFGLRKLHLSDEEIERRVHQACDEVGLPPDLLQRSPFQLSGGQMRRVALAGVIAMQPKLLVLDEPTAGLDARGCRLIMDAIASMQRRRRMTVILVTHNMDDIAEYAERMAILNAGRVVAEGEPARIFGQYGRNLRQWGLDLPTNNDVVQQLADRGWPLDRGLLRTSEVATAIARQYRTQTDQVSGNEERTTRGSVCGDEHHVL